MHASYRATRLLFMLPVLDCAISSSTALQVLLLPHGV